MKETIFYSSAFSAQGDLYFRVHGIPRTTAEGEERNTAQAEKYQEMIYTDSRRGSRLMTRK